MAFTNISVATGPIQGVWNPTGTGVYTKDTVLVGGPTDQVKISAGKVDRNNKTNAAITRTLQKDVVVGSDTLRRMMSYSIQIQMEEGFTTTDVDNGLEMFSIWLTTTVLNRILLGES